MDTGKRIKEIRKANGITQKELSEKLGTSQQNIAQYENGKRQPKFETLRRIAKALDVGLDEFMSDTELSLFEGMADLYLHSSNDIKDISPCEAGSIQERYLMEAFRALNREGQNKVADYADDLLGNPKYHRKNA